MTLLLAIGVGILLLLIGISCAAIGLHPSGKFQTSDRKVFRTLHRIFEQYIHTRLSIGLYCVIVLTAPFMTAYVYEWLYEPAMFEHVVMLSLPWIALVIFAALTVPFRLEGLQKEDINHTC
ncbi:MAG: hypothetical protein JW779_01305 [Candidatus Thorarchaeota archaeon]|nr:hypothetical protein [Candidatus Thorarchaeota archaeon]